MSTITEAAETAVVDLRGESPSWWTTWRRHARNKPLGAIGAAFIFVLIIAAIFGQDINIGGSTIIPGFSPYPASETNIINKLASPTFPEHIAGTDSLGRDLFSRIIYGARPAIVIGIVATGLGILGGMVIGMISAYAGGVTDLLLQRISDAFQALPPLLLMMTLVTVLTPSMTTVILVIVIFLIPGTQRVVRGTVFSTLENTYIEAARTIGAGPGRIITRHILPNIMAPILVIASVTIGGTILAEAALSFLGLGANSAENPTWGFILFEATQRGNLDRWPWLALTPGAAITLIVLAFNLLGDALRDVLDPRLRGTGAGA
ncbi:MAG: ABC transporter permease [Chloroflexi bacterium]|nr:ABC transporter permease [Chloroflexota bacterium]